MGDGAAKSALYDALSSVPKALGSGRRAEIVDVLAQGERPVEQIAGEIGQTVANTSQHLRLLLRVGLVRTRRDGTRIYYRLAGPPVADLWRAVRDVASAHVAELDQLATAYVGDRASLDVVTRDELRQRLQDGDVVVVDVRPASEYRTAHISGAVSLPVEELVRRLSELPRNPSVVAYCRGPYCVFADEAVRTLREHGYRASRLEDGFPEWAAAGLPVQRASAAGS